MHEDLERLERVIVKDYAQETRTYKEKLMQNHRVRRRLDTMQEAARKLVGRAWAQEQGCHAHMHMRVVDAAALLEGQIGCTAHLHGVQVLACCSASRWAGRGMQLRA